jgi:purine-nucleoside phosphorylase
VNAPTPHNAAQPGDIADAVLLPGDPLRAKVIADTFFESPVQYNAVRGMLGFTGTYKGRRVSVQGTGMGMPSISIYVTELFRFYGVKTAIRVGSCGAIQDFLNLRDIVIGMAAHTTSGMNRNRFPGLDFAPAASFELVSAAHRIAAERGITAHVGTICSSDSFYDDPVDYRQMAKFGTLALEMEGAALYTIAAGEGVRALCLATVSDHITKEEATSAEERQTSFLEMAEVALETVLATDPA